MRSDYSIVGQGVQEPFIHRVRQEMEAAGIEIYACQAEYGLGQWEVNFVHSDALEMADRHVIYRAGLKELALGQGLSVTFMARPLSSDVGSSCHLHCSLWDGETPIFASEAPRLLSDRGTHFEGGLLEHVDETALFNAPYVNSYRRHIPDDFGGGIKAWGYDNRTVAVRVVGHANSLHVEFRYPGADVNPYLAAAAKIAAGPDGIDRSLDPGDRTSTTPTRVTTGCHAHPDLWPAPPRSSRPLDSSAIRLVKRWWRTMPRTLKLSGSAT